MFISAPIVPAKPIKQGSVQSIEFYYAGTPQETGRFGGISFRKDPAGRHWITTVCEGIGTSIWWANKDQQREDVLRFYTWQTGTNLAPIFDQYLRHAVLPVLELRFEEGRVAYRWKADVKEFAMPIKVGNKSNWQTIHPRTEWQTMATKLKKEEFEVATELFYVEVSRL